MYIAKLLITELMKTSLPPKDRSFPFQHVKPPLARLIQNGFTGETKAGEARKTGFSWLLVYFSPGLQNGFTLTQNR